MLHKIRWTTEKISRRIEFVEDQIYRHRQEIPPFRYQILDAPMTPPPVAPEVDDSDWELIGPHEYWAPPRTNFVLRTTFSTGNLEGAAGPIALFLPIGIAGNFSHPEALAYIDGEPYAACDRHHQEIILPAKYCDGAEHTLALHGWTGIGGNGRGDMSDRLKMNPCEVVQIDQPTRDFVALARVTLGIAVQLEERDPAKHHLLTALEEAFQDLDIRHPLGPGSPRPYETIPAALNSLQDDLAKAGPALDVDISAIGHAHIDVAWLWTLDQTRQKSGRTFHNVLRNMEKFPGFVFGQSQPQLYDYVRQDFPDLFEAIKARVEDGRWETIGGMWVEADCNLSGPESLARQFLLGRNFFREHFGQGVDSPVLWLPDVFGYAWNLPQLIKEAGLEYFFTIKIGWSQYNRLPYDSFWWQGLDGTKVLTHFSTTKAPGSPFAATYNSDATPGEIMGTWTNFQQKDYGPVGKIPPMLMSYGFGDGGGGPTPEMLENIRELNNFPAAPKIKPEKVGDFFQKLAAVSENLPTWNGELYLEYHRGTYTTQARNKKGNRESEFLLHDAEFLATYASLLDPNYQYPFEQFTKAWQLVCLNQFHDIIPGSSIGPVYAQSLEQYAEVKAIAGATSDTALAVIAEKMGAETVIVNPTSFTRDEVLEIEGNSEDIRKIKPFSVQTFRRSNVQPATLNISQTHLENDFLRVDLNDHGDIIRIFDKVAKREVLPDDAIANQFLAFEDIPLRWDAWDIDIFYDDKVWLAEGATSIAVVEATPYRATLEIKRRILNSDYTQRISLTHNSHRLDFDTCIDWQERQILLKVAFPVDVFTPTATYEIQWGNVERPTHRNTSWDWARFETAAQKWVDLSEGNYGVSLLNDCKYGHDIHQNTMRLTLLRGTTTPDPEADYGEQTFKYSLFPHEGSWGVETVKEAYALNDPLVVYHQTATGGQETENGPRSSVPRLPSFVSVDRENIVIETIKRAEDGDGIIIRMYECQRQRGEFTLKTVFPIGAAYRTNILEENQEEIPAEGTKLSYAIKPYQILTLRLTIKGAKNTSDPLTAYNAKLLERRIVTDPGQEQPKTVESAGLKFEPTGEIKPYYGLTAMAWIDPESPLFQNLKTLQSSIHTELRGESLNDEFAFLAPESFHMTICDITAKSEPYSQAEAETVQAQIRAAFPQGVALNPIQAQVSGIGLNSTITALVRFSVPGELQKVQQLETQIKTATQVNVREFTGHITLAYCVKSPGEQIGTLREVLQAYQERDLGEFMISEFDLTYFNDMNTYIPLTTINFENGTVSDHDNLDQCEFS
jgi:alpha-mannosidase